MGIYPTPSPAPAERRAEALLGELADLPLRPGLGDLRAASGEDLPGWTEFLPAWIALLRADEDYGDWHGAWKRELLTEAVLLHSGVDGLADLARERGTDQPELHLELVRQLEREGLDERAVEAAREALAAVPAGRVRAQIADRLGALEQDPAACLAARRAAWRSGSSRERLLALVRAARGRVTPPAPSTRSAICCRGRPGVGSDQTTSAWPAR